MKLSCPHDNGSSCGPWVKWKSHQRSYKAAMFVTKHGKPFHLLWLALGYFHMIRSGTLWKKLGPPCFRWNHGWQCDVKGHYCGLLGYILFDIITLEKLKSASILSDNNAYLIYLCKIFIYILYYIAEYAGTAIKSDATITLMLRLHTIQQTKIYII